MRLRRRHQNDVDAQRVLKGMTEITEDKNKKKSESDNVRVLFYLDDAFKHLFV